MNLDGYAKAFVVEDTDYDTVLNSSVHNFFVSCPVLRLLMMLLVLQVYIQFLRKLKIMLSLIFQIVKIKSGIKLRRMK